MDTTRTMILAFGNSSGGQGARLDVTSVTASVQVPPSGAQQDDEFLCVTNYGFSPAFIKMGKSGVTATTACQCVLPGTQVLFDVPYSTQSELYVAAICESGETTKLQLTRGIGN